MSIFINADQASTASPKAPAVGEAMKNFIDAGAFNASRGIYAGAFDTEAMLYRTREQLCDLFDAPKIKNVTFTSGVTLALNVLFYGILQKGDHVITSSMEHNAVMRPLTHLRDDGRIEFSLAAADKQGRLDPEKIVELIKPETKLIVVTAASNVVGTRLPIREIGKICQEKGIMFAVDSAQLAGTYPISMREENIDALTVTGHKGLMGPQGVGALILSDTAADLIEPLVCGGTGSFSQLETMPEPLPDRLEAGTLPLPAIAGLSAALDWIEETGIFDIHEHKADLTAQFLRRISEIPGVRIFGISDPEEREGRVAVVSLQLDGMDPAELSQRLSEAGVLTRVGLHCAPRAHQTIGSYPQGTVRFSFAYNHSLSDVDKVADILKSIVETA
ncbi:MAG: aminotransferase class V-fold PLP-dependent enzyme [Eubacteriales bacterium]|nr:aminotransferase class V-fold PLP-dependent enzyme [Eubacteriales bacterium]MDD4323674.1 aminotransferase class V-fold PLP-dependent enzyme [Eubacteriales bacterium]MDD4540664.1 aminotransferase class V-fold PLP-dependent enzyme [Eubacteriales bacterium]